MIPQGNRENSKIQLRDYRDDAWRECNKLRGVLHSCLGSPNNYSGWGPSLRVQTSGHLVSSSAVAGPTVICLAGMCLRGSVHRLQQADGRIETSKKPPRPRPRPHRGGDGDGDGDAELGGRWIVPPGDTAAGCWYLDTRCCQHNNPV